MATREAVVESWFQEPAEVMFTGWPEHKVPRYFSCQCVGPSPALFDVDPLRADAEHKFGFPRQRPGLLEEEVRIPFLGSMGVEGRNAHFEFQPVLYRLDFHCKIRSECGCASADVPACRGADLQDGFILFVVNCRFGRGGRGLRRTLAIGRQTPDKYRQACCELEGASRHSYIFLQRLKNGFAEP